MLDPLVARGPDASGRWVDGPVGLGHRMLWTTPESLNETLPLANPAGNLAITSDARIDNRDELISDCGIRGPASHISDSQLILAAYEKWGEKCPERLFGDFAFVIWDQRQQALLCARDGMGVVPFYYHSSRDVFLFASEIKALLAMAGVPRELNEMKVADYITKNFADSTATFYKDIYRLDPGHTLTVSKRGTSRRCYWALDPSREVRLPSDEAYAEALREIFARAVRCRLRSAFPVSSELSGGLDSSSIVCMARELLLNDGRQPLHTFSAIFDQTPCADERRYLEAVLAKGDVRPHFLEVERLDPLGDLDLRFQELDEPFWVPALYIHRAFFQLAHDHGVRVMLSGFDGDNAIGYGENFISDLSRRGRLISAFKEASAYARQSHQSRWVCVRFYAIKPWIPQRLLELVRPGAKASPGLIDLMASEFSERIDYEGRRARRPAPPHRVEEARRRHWRRLTGGYASYQCEVLNKAASRFSIETRHPFFDRRLLDFCLGVPGGQKLKNGYIRSILRRALKGTLPELVRWRVDKANARPAIVEALRRPGDGHIDELMQNGRQNLGKYVDLASLDQGYARLMSGDAKSKSDYSIWGPITLARWLQLYERVQTTVAAR